MNTIPRGRKRKFSEYEELLQSLPKGMRKRPKYVNGIGVFRGSKAETAWVKLSLPHGATYKGKNYAAGSPLEMKLGNLSSWSWQQLEDKHRELQGKADRGEPLEDQKQILFKDWAEDWLSRSKSRVKGYGILLGHIKNHLAPTFGNKSLGDISVADISRWQSKQLETLKPGTVKRQLNTLKACLNDAIKSEHLEKNPCSGADKIRGINRRQKFLDMEEMLKLLAAAEKSAPWFADLLIWYLHSGMRKSEALGVKWSDIKTLPNGSVIVELNKTKSGEGRQVVCTKSMKEIIERQSVQRKDGDDRLFPHAPITVRRKWTKVREEAGLSDVVMHDLRRTHATHAVTAGVDMRTLMGRMGHTDLDMLQKHYAILQGSAAEEAANLIEASLTRSG
ncbi:MAG: site-specific integrase [Rhodospirillaceae bacterium]|jgi:integrase|nr:site-specific integrase [Rhodospirillaceae bacterium]